MNRRFRMPIRGSVLVLLAATGVGGCRAVATSRSTATLFPPASFEEAPRGDHRVVHAPGACDLCDLYYTARTQVVRLRTADGQGAGIVISGTGGILTNAHVVEGDDAPTVETYSGEVSAAKVVRRGMDADLAVVAVEPPSPGWAPMRVQACPLPAVGTDVYVIGHPVGLGWTVTRGIVSAVRIPGEVRPSAMIQTDAAISPGNSGGPLLDREGRVLGVVVAKLAGRGIENVAFAIPASDAAKFLAESLPEAPSVAEESSEK